MNTVINNNESVMFPDAEHDYHGHPNYTKILVSLLSLLTFSLIIGYFVSPMLAIILIFATATWKAALVMRNFMHLKYEPFLLFIAISAVLLIILTFFFGVYPDITAITPEVAKPR